MTKTIHCHLGKQIILFYNSMGQCAEILPFFFRHVTSVEKDKKFGIALPLLSDGPPPGHRGLYMTHVPHNLEPLLKLTIA